MPSVLVYVEPERVATLRHERDRWVLRRGELIDPELVRPPDWTLYFATMRADAVHIIGYLEDAAVDRDVLGMPTACDVDVTPVVERLGCAAGAAGFTRWASVPVVLTKDDADLLRYRLGLPLDMVVPPPIPTPPKVPELPTGFEHDATALKLLEAVYDDLGSDANRMVLADRLLELGDPRGEMIALQLSRARTGAPASERELDLIVRHGRTWAQPLTTCLRAYAFRRGFLTMAEIDDRVMARPQLVENIAWSTVENLETCNMSLLLSPAMRSLRRVAIPSETLAALARHDGALPLETIVGATVAAPGTRVVQGGVPIHGDTLDALLASTALERVRGMCLAIESTMQAQHAMRLLASPFGQRLQHIELYRSRASVFDVERWRQAYERNRPLSMGLRTFVDDWVVVIVRHRGSIIVQLGDPQSDHSPNLQSIIAVVSSFGHGLREVTVERVGEDRGANMQPVIGVLRQAFARVELARTQRWRSP